MSFVKISRIDLSLLLTTHPYIPHSHMHFIHSHNSRLADRISVYKQTRNNYDCFCGCLSFSHCHSFWSVTNHLRVLAWSITEITITKAPLLSFMWWSIYWHVNWQRRVVSLAYWRIAWSYIRSIVYSDRCRAWNFVHLEVRKRCLPLPTLYLPYNLFSEKLALQ